MDTNQYSIVFVLKIETNPWAHLSGMAFFSQYVECKAHAVVASGNADNEPLHEEAGSVRKGCSHRQKYDAGEGARDK